MKPAPTPPWITLPAILFQGCGMFVLPFAVGLIAALFFDIAEVAETSTVMIGFTVALLFPVALAQVLGLALKSYTDLRYWRARGGLGIARTLDVLHDHLRVVTLRGWTVLALGLLLIGVALAAQWAEFGLMATFALFLFYAVTGWTVFASTFLIGAFERARSKRGTIQRRLEPTVQMAGGPVEEVFTFEHVPVPWGYVLVVEDANNPRLRTESRYVLGPEARRGAEVRGRLRATPRGHYFLGPARIAYQDILGITRVSVALAATAELKILPTFRTVEIVDPPRTLQTSPDVITRPHRFPTEDLFRFREYAAGDDTRRIHWALSLRSGGLHVRQPETRELQTEDVILALDTFMPPGTLIDASLGAEEILDRLVETWLGIARTLVERGDRVTLVAAVGTPDGGTVEIEAIKLISGERTRWLDIGARARWQSAHDVPALLAEIGEKVHGMVVTGRFIAAPPIPQRGQRMSWVALDPGVAMGPPDRFWWFDWIGGKTPFHMLNWVFRLPHPAGAEENSLLRRVSAGYFSIRRYRARAKLRQMAQQRAGTIVSELSTRGDSVYRIETFPTFVRVVGLVAGSGRIRP